MQTIPATGANYSRHWRELFRARAQIIPSAAQTIPATARTIHAAAQIIIGFLRWFIGDTQQQH